ncbi:MAG: CBS domain-containing protein [Pseudomonadota bacterium]|nr:CBS domain-containing protein [Pseudomonadota bacterium]
MAKLGTESDVLEESEQTIIHNLLRFSKVLVKDVMTPRIVVNTASEEITVREFQNVNSILPHSRIPVYREKNDNITGYVLRDDILLNLAETQDHILLKALRRDIVVVHRTVPIPDLLDTFLIKKEHMALVVDEFGGMEGIVTMEDIIETLLGLEIVDESDNEADMQALARSNWERRAKRLGIIPKTGGPGTSENNKSADS